MKFKDIKIGMKVKVNPKTNTRGWDRGAKDLIGKTLTVGRFETGGIRQFYVIDRAYFFTASEVVPALDKSMLALKKKMLN